MSARARALLARLDLRDRVTLATAAVLAGGLAVLSAGALLLLSAQLDHDISSTLAERADAQLAGVVQRDGRMTLRPAADDVLDEQAWVFDAQGRVLRRPHATAAVDQAARGLAGATDPVERDVGEQVRLRAEPIAAAGGGRPVGTVVVGLSLRPYDRTEHLMLLAVAILDVCIVIFGALLARRAVGKALQPVADMTAQAAEWSEHDLDRRFDLGPPRDELTALSATLDALLARIASSVRREQRFSAEMAHELRTPLTGVRGEAELALRAPGPMPPEVRAGLEQILRGTERMQGVIDALLAAARGEDGGGVSDARAAARTAVEAAAHAAAGAEVAVTLADGGGGIGRDSGDSSGSGGGSGGELPASALRVGAERQLVAQALAPLLDNAIRHARGTVAVRIERDGGAVLIHVEDDGPGLSGDELERVFAPGVSSSGGAGLGLPLARRLARSAGGELTAAAAQAGRGGHFVLRLPAVG